MAIMGLIGREWVPDAGKVVGTVVGTVDINGVGVAGLFLGTFSVFCATSLFMRETRAFLSLPRGFYYFSHVTRATASFATTLRSGTTGSTAFAMSYNVFHSRGTDLWALLLYGRDFF